MGLWSKVFGRAPGSATPAGMSPAAPAPAERIVVSVPAELLVADVERVPWHGRPRSSAGFGPRGGAGVTHVGGADGSAARSVPRDLAGPVTLTVTDRRLVISAEVAPGTPSIEVAAFDRTDIRWIARTGRSDGAGAHVRCSLADESFFDVAIGHADIAAFLGAAGDPTT